MKISLTKQEKQFFETVARQYDINPRGLIDCYKAIMDCNFRQDVWDVARENEDDLRKDYGSYEN